MMAKFNDLLHLRFKQKETKQQKMSALAERSNKGELSSFSGVFRVTTLSEPEREGLESILSSYRHDTSFDIEPDLQTLCTITSEVKAITNQAVILHGERIKRAQNLLKHYRDGAFTAWLFTTYGNRQTPYNFLQYYEFYTTVTPDLHPKIDQMPRQVIYSLASRSGPLEKKEELLKAYSGQPKKELLTLIRKEFPLAEDDKRTPNYTAQAISFIKRARDSLKNSRCKPEEDDKRLLRVLIAQLNDLLEKR